MPRHALVLPVFCGSTAACLRAQAVLETGHVVLADSGFLPSFFFVRRRSPGNKKGCSPTHHGHQLIGVRQDLSQLAHCCYERSNCQQGLGDRVGPGCEGRSAFKGKE